jgi:hypothetical protein
LSCPAPALEMTPFDSHQPDPRPHASATLRRLVGFVAAALDSRYAFASALGRRDSRGRVRTVDLWMAKDYGLSVDVAGVELPDHDTAAPFDYSIIARRIWPEWPELTQMSAAHCVTVPLLDRRGRLLGHLGLLDRGPGAGFSRRERLHPLVRIATTEVERWNRD